MSSETNHIKKETICKMCLTPQFHWHCKSNQIFNHFFLFATISSMKSYRKVFVQIFHTVKTYGINPANCFLISFQMKNFSEPSWEENLQMKSVNINNIVSCKTIRSNMGVKKQKWNKIGEEKEFHNRLLRLQKKKEKAR